jgi:hypothetical protein
MRRKLCLIAALLIVRPASASSDDPLKQSAQLKTMRTEYLRLVYLAEHRHVAAYLASCFENSMQFHRELFDYTPSEEVTVLMQDFDDIGYAGATAVPYNWMTVGIEPFEYAYEVSPTNQPINWVMSHELLHVVASDQATGSDRFFRKMFFGKVTPDDQDPVSLVYGYLTAPRRFAPRWYHEGGATFMETWMSGGIGRVLGGYDEMVFRAMVVDTARFHRLVGLESEGTTTDFQVGQNAYLYGTRFIAYCAYQYGPEKVVEWFRRGEGDKRRYSAQFKRVFGRNLGDVWDEWIEREHEWQEANLDSLRLYPLTRYRPLTDKPLGSVSRAHFDPDSRKLYVAALYPNEFAHVVEIDIDTGEMRKITDVRMAALYYVTWLAYDEADKRLFFTTDNAKGWRDLHAVDVASRKTRELHRNARTGDLAFNRADKSVWGIFHYNGFSSVVRFKKPYTTFDYVYSLPFGYDLYDIDVSPDGEYLTGSSVDASGERRLVQYAVDSLLTGDNRVERESFGFLGSRSNVDLSNFVHSRDGRHLFGTSYYSGVSNVYRFDFETRKLEIITNADTGFFRPVPVSDDSLIVFRFTSEGFQPVMIGIEPIDDLTTAQMAAPTPEEKQEKVTVRPIRFLGSAIAKNHPVVANWNIGSPAEINLDSLTIEAGDYHDFRNIKLNAVYPIVQSYNGRVAWGLRFNLREPNYLHAFEVDALVTPSESLPDEEKGHAAASYTRGNWEFGGTYNRSDFYDFFGPTKTSRKGYSLSVQYGDQLIDEAPKVLDYKLAVAGFAELEKLPFYQNVPVFQEYVSAFGQLGYANMRTSIGGLGKEKGIGWQLNGLLNVINPDESDTTAASRSVYSRLWLNVDIGFRLPWAHSSVWLRPSVGQSFAPREDPINPLSTFYFGGFGNNWVDHRPVERYREFYALPGTGLYGSQDEINLDGANYAKAMVEWVLPPLRFSNLGKPTFYLNSAQLAFFTTAITTNVDDDALDGTVFDVGGQLNVRLVSLFSLPYTFSVGYAAAFKGSRRSDEWMVSLKIF